MDWGNGSFHLPRGTCVPTHDPIGLDLGPVLKFNVIIMLKPTCLKVFVETRIHVGSREVIRPAGVQERRNLRRT